MPSTMATIVFVLDVIAATIAAWMLFDQSAAKAAVFLLAMLFGGSIYFLMKARS